AGAVGRVSGWRVGADAQWLALDLSGAGRAGADRAGAVLALPGRDLAAGAARIIAPGPPAGELWQPAETPSFPEFHVVRRLRLCRHDGLSHRIALCLYRPVWHLRPGLWPA